MKIYNEGNAFAIETDANCPLELAQQYGQFVSRMINDPAKNVGAGLAFQLAGHVPVYAALHNYLEKGNIGDIEIAAYDDILYAGDLSIIPQTAA